MKSYLLLFFSIILFNSCSSDDTPTFTVQTEADIINYIEENNLEATKTDSGLYYVINNEGTGNRPNENSVVNIDYKGSFLDGTIYSQSDSTIIQIDQIIEGLKEGLQLFKEGGDGILILPSELAYGTSGNSTGSIPGGAVLVFDITLTVADYADENETAILKYIEDNNLNATKTSSGLYYVVNNEGTGERPTTASNVTVAYKGYYLDGSVFDESTENGVSFNLSQVIAGWTEGIPYFKEGGDGTLLIPFNLGYGVYGNGTIPEVSVLLFDINLIKVNY
ncbi:FKBP-type peptidyl-prolyl cis-trans isomerase [Polaribacter sp.]|uniref:FKBP-type peptidyl-prolyl cis-trans isomerase n=1 Tax=Polaribacter sp. TaxID=1920175 RepID=UPI003EFA077F